MKNQWQNYQQLELISDSFSAESGNKILAALRLAWVGRSLINFFTHQLSSTQQIEHLEQCLALDSGDADCAQPDYSLQWWESALAQLLPFPQLTASPEPEIWQSVDRSKRLWWHVYDPKTGKTTDWETEEEVRIWLEERIHRY